MPRHEFRVDNEGLADMVCAVAAACADDLCAALSIRRGAVSVGDIYEQVRNNVRYTADNDTNNQRIRAPWVTLDEGAGDCKSTAVLIYGLAIAAGLSAHLRFYDQTGQGWDHVVSIVENVPVDPLLELGDEVDAVKVRDVYI